MRTYVLLSGLLKFLLISQFLLFFKRFKAVRLSWFRKTCSNKFHTFSKVDYFVPEYRDGICRAGRFDCFFRPNFIVFTEGSCNNLSLKINAFYRFKRSFSTAALTYALFFKSTQVKRRRLDNLRGS
jgi:hypothetical protein